MTYISKLGLPLKNQIDIISDVFDVNLSLQKNSIPISQGIGIFNTTFSEFNTSSEDGLQLDISDFITSNEYLSSEIVSEPEIDIENRLLKIQAKVIKNDITETRGLIFDEIF